MSLPRSRNSVQVYFARCFSLASTERSSTLPEDEYAPGGGCCRVYPGAGKKGTHIHRQHDHGRLSSTARGPGIRRLAGGASRHQGDRELRRLEARPTGGPEFKGFCLYEVRASYDGMAQPARGWIRESRVVGGYSSIAVHDSGHSKSKRSK